jgi:hypothetical protein
MLSAAMVQVPVDQVVDVVAMRYCIMTASGCMLVSFVMVCAIVIGSALGLVAGTDANRVLVNMIVMHVMQMIIMQIAAVVVMLYRDMTAICAMLVLVTLVRVTGHGIDFSCAQLFYTYANQVRRQTMGTVPVFSYPPHRTRIFSGGLHVSQRSSFQHRIGNQQIVTF